MKYLLAILIVAIIVVITLLIKKKQRKKITNNNNKLVKVHDSDLQAATFVFETFPVEEFKDDSSLVEIKDSKLLAKINNIVPEAAKSANAAENAINASKETLYRVIIPSGAKLSKSRDMEGAVRAIYRDSKNIKGQANLVAVEKGGAVAANVASSAMNVASMVVGQYYMAQINDELSSISNNIDKVLDFQKTEYKGKVQSLASQVKKIASYESEILENNELRRDEIQNLNRLESTCTELLGQANLSIAEFQKKKDISYEEYQSCLKDAQDWYMCQGILLQVLEAISELRYALYLGEISKENSFALMDPYFKQAEQSLQLLSDWHNGIAERLEIDIDRETIKRSGFDGVIHFIPGLFNSEQKYKQISKETVGIIKAQTEEQNIAVNKLNNYYQEDTQIVFKDGKTYLLLSKMENE